VPTLPAFGFTLGLVPDIELDSGLVVYVVTMEIRTVDNAQERYDTQ
jgi:hypothetical protein